MVFSVLSSNQQLNGNRRKQDNWTNDLIVGQSPAGKKVSRLAEDIVEIRHQTTTDEGTAD
jgi:hypothetical protein